MQEFDLVVIGAGPAGYIGAIRAAQLGMKVACIEKRKTLGGTCLNVGCIPSKALLHSSSMYEKIHKEASLHGIKIDSIILDLEKMIERKNNVVSDLTKGIEGLFVKNKITKIIGQASLLENNIIEVKEGENLTQIKGHKILIATGSDAITLPNINIDEINIVSSTGALDLKKVPSNMIVMGGGYIGLEMGSIWQRLGSRVTIIEFADRIVPALDLEVGKALHKVLEKQGLNFKLNTKLISAEVKNNQVDITIESQGKSEQIKTDVLLVSVGRKPHTSSLGLEKIGIKLDERGRIEVNSNFETNIKNIYAVGDVIKGPMLAHKAEEEAVAAVEMMQGQKPHINYNYIPSVIYTNPEVAYVGKTEEELKDSNTPYKIGKFPFLANSKARAIGEKDGFVKILACASTDKILGLHIIGPEAGNLIAEAVIALEFQASSEDIARICHAHPTLNEAIKEAALAVDKRTLNI